MSFSSENVFRGMLDEEDAMVAAATGLQVPVQAVYGYAYISGVGATFLSWRIGAR